MYETSSSQTTSEVGRIAAVEREKVQAASAFSCIDAHLP
jgi:hypothetical protein